MEDIDLTMLARSAYRAILRSIESPEAEEPETVKEVVPMVAKLHSSGILNNAEYAAQSGELSRKVSALRSERRRILMEDEDDEIIESLKSMDSVLAEYTPTAAFDEELFGQIVESVTVVSGTTLRFCLAGGLALTENL